MTAKRVLRVGLLTLALASLIQMIRPGAPLSMIRAILFSFTVSGPPGAGPPAPRATGASRPPGRGAPFAAPAYSTQWLATLAGIAVLTMVFGNIVALAQSDIKRMMAYSSIAQAGYMLVGLVAVGTAAEVMKLKGAGTQVIDLAGRTMLPGFVDAHRDDPLPPDKLSSRVQMRSTSFGSRGGGFLIQLNFWSRTTPAIRNAPVTLPI